MSSTPQTSRNTSASLVTSVKCIGKTYIEFINSDTNSVNIFIDGVYNITWYDPTQQKLISNKNIHITDLNMNRIKGQYIQDNCPTECLCYHREDLYKYVSQVTVNIPLCNIVAITDVSCGDPDECKEVTRMSILGISTEFIRSVIIRLRIYKDNVEEEIIPIDMEVGKTYNVQYMDHVDHTMYEIEGVLEKIMIDRHFGDEPPQTGFVRPECPNPEEIGIGNSVYYNQEHFMELPKDCPEKVVFIFDTSKFTQSTHDKVRLTDIRDVYKVDTEEDKEPEDSANEDGKCCETCPYMGGPVQPMPPMPGYPVPPKPRPPIRINEFTIAKFTMDDKGMVIEDCDGNELERISYEALIKAYTQDKY